MFNVPVPLNLTSQPIEQLRMAGPFPLSAEIARGFHQANAEELLPEPVHCDAGRERMARADQPARELQAVGSCAGGQWGQHRRHSRLYLFASFVVLAALENVSLLWFVHVLHHHGGGQRIIQFVPLLPGRSDFFEERLED